MFTGITLKHYAYYNLSRRTQLTTKFLFTITAQLSENFIFIYLGLTLFTQTDLVFKPLFILVTVVGICGARWLSVFPLSRAINAIIRMRAKRRGVDAPDELPYNYQCMLFWAGLRGAVGVALAAGLSGENGPALRATVLVVVVLTVIIFGGTTARMLEILGIRTGVVEEIDSDDEFDIETTNAGTYYKRNGAALGHTPKSSANIGLNNFRSQNGAIYSSGKNPGGRYSRSGPSRPHRLDRGYSSSNGHSPSFEAHNSGQRSLSRKSSAASNRDQAERNALLFTNPSIVNTDDSLDFLDDDDDDTATAADLDLPPAAPRRNTRTSSEQPHPDLAVPASEIATDDPADISSETTPQHGLGSIRGIRDMLRGATQGDSVAWLQQLDENFIKPTLLLDQGQGQGHSHGHHHGPGNV